MIQLDGKTVLVAGASRGIGLLIADLCELAGARVARASRSLAPSQDEQRLDVRCDLTSPDDVAALHRRVESAFGLLDVVVHNTGSFLLKPLDRTTPAEFSGQLTANLESAFLLAHEFLPSMRAARGGRFIAVGSIADHRAFPQNAAYSAAKFGLRGLHEVLREEYRGTGVLCSLVSPGPTDTAVWDPYDPDRRPDLPDRSAMLRPEDVADAVLWIATRPAHVDIDWLRMEPAAPGI